MTDALSQDEKGGIASNTTADATTAAASDEYLVWLLQQTLQYAREREYTGYDYFDGMSSELLHKLPIENKWVNIAVQETIKRFPINVRPYFLVQKRQNFKGSALFVMANLTAYELTGNASYRSEARELVDWLIDHQSSGYNGFCGGHRHEMQQLDERRPANTPNVVPTSYATKALLRASSLDSKYASMARKAADFLFDELEYTELNTGARIKYQPHYTGKFYTLNGGAIGARLLIDLYSYFDENIYKERATALLDYIVTKQTDLGGWMYREPASASHLSMDNHHNGFIIESLLRYQEVTGSRRYERTIEDAVSFYRSTLFEVNGAPNWDETKHYPKDIHAATQGIIVFTLAGEPEFARRIIDWTLANLYAGEGQFYYQKRRLYTKRFTLMRWCQAWVAYALSVYLDARELNSGE